MNSAPMRVASSALNDHHDHRGGDRRRRVAQHEVQRRPVGLASPLHGPVLLLLDAAGDEKCNRRRHERDGQDQRPQQRHDHGECHGVEHFSLDAGERENGDVHQRHDDHADQAGLEHFARGLEYRFEALAAVQQPPFLMLLHRHPAQAVLDDDHRAVHDQAEVQRAQAHQVGADLVLHHAGNEEQHGQRDHRRGEQGGAPVAEQREQHDDHQHRAFEQVLRDRRDGLVHQRRAVVDGLRDHALRQRAVDLRKLRRDALRNGAAVLAQQHEHGAQHDFLAVLGGGAGAQFLAQQHLGHVPDADRHIAFGADDDVADFVEGRHLAGRANQVLLAALLDVAGADVGVVPGERFQDVPEVQAVGDQLRGIGGDVELLQVAADGVDLGDAGNVAQLRAHDPVLDGAQLRRRVLAAVRPASRLPWAPRST